MPLALKKRGEKIRGSGPTPDHKLKDWLAERQKYGDILFQSFFSNWPSIVPFRFGEGFFRNNPQLHMLFTQQYAKILSDATKSKPVDQDDNRRKVYIEKDPKSVLGGELLLAMVDAMENFVLLPGIFKVYVAFTRDRLKEDHPGFSVVDKLLRIRDRKIKGTFTHALAIVKTLMQYKKQESVKISVTVDREAVMRHGTRTLNKIFGRPENYGLETPDMVIRQEIKQLTERVLLKAVAEVEDVEGHRLIRRSYVEDEIMKGNNIKATEQNAARYYFTLSALGYLLKNARENTGILAQIDLGPDHGYVSEIDSYHGYSVTGNNYFEQNFERLSETYRKGGTIRFQTLFCGWLLPMIKRHFLELPKMCFAGRDESVEYDYFDWNMDMIPFEICLGRYAYMRYADPSLNKKNFMGRLNLPIAQKEYQFLLSSCPNILRILDRIGVYVRDNAEEKMVE
jgi:hypothetical protein